jgi:hypothetical protein
VSFDIAALNKRLERTRREPGFFGNCAGESLKGAFGGFAGEQSDRIFN